MKKRKSLDGYVEKNWLKKMIWGHTFESGRITLTQNWFDIRIPIISKTPLAYTTRKNPVKVRITIEEL